MKAKILYISLAALTFCAAMNRSYAQEKVDVEGVVVEADGKDTPLDYAVVSIKQADLHTVTDAKGGFRFTGLTGGEKSIFRSSL